LPHPVRTRPAMAIGAAYRIVFTPLCIPTPGGRAELVHRLVHECHPLVS
jgi:hypothetical protein